MMVQQETKSIVAPSSTSRSSKSCKASADNEQKERYHETLPFCAPHSNRPRCRRCTGIYRRPAHTTPKRDHFWLQVSAGERMHQSKNSLQLARIEHGNEHCGGRLQLNAARAQFTQQDQSYDEYVMRNTGASQYLFLRALDAFGARPFAGNRLFA